MSSWQLYTSVTLSWVDFRLLPSDWSCGCSWEVSTSARYWRGSVLQTTSEIYWIRDINPRFSSYFRGRQRPHSQVSMLLRQYPYQGIRLRWAHGGESTAAVLACEGTIGHSWQFEEGIYAQRCDLFVWCQWQDEGEAVMWVNDQEPVVKSSDCDWVIDRHWPSSDLTIVRGLFPF